MNNRVSTPFLEPSREIGAWTALQRDGGSKGCEDSGSMNGAKVV
jgi:hypothetical protein